MVLLRQRNAEGNPSSPLKAAYLEHPAMRSFPNVRLVSQEGEEFKMNAALLAAASKLLASIIQPTDTSADDCQVILTEISKEHLTAFCQFVMSGIFPEATVSPEFSSSFSHLGINLRDFKLDPVPKVDHNIKMVPELRSEEQQSSKINQVKDRLLLSKKFMLNVSGGNTNGATKQLKKVPVKKLHIAYKCPKCPFLALSQDQLATHKEGHETSTIDQQVKSNQKPVHQVKQELPDEDMFVDCEEESKYSDEDFLPIKNEVSSNEVEANKVTQKAQQEYQDEDMFSDGEKECEFPDEDFVSKEENHVKVEDDSFFEQKFEPQPTGLNSLPRIDIQTYRAMKKAAAASCLGSRGNYKKRCKTCKGCKAKKCGKCTFCLNPQKKQQCVEKICLLPKIQSLETKRRDEQEIKNNKYLRNMLENTEIISSSKTAEFQGQGKFSCFKCIFSTDTYTKLLQHCLEHELKCDKDGACRNDITHPLDTRDWMDKKKKLEKTLEGCIYHLCLHCGADMANKSEEQEQLHMDKFHGNFKNQCPICQDFEYSSYEEHKKHNDEYHDGKFVSRCNKCAEFFDNEALLKTHKQKLHPSEKQQKSACHICGKEVGNRHALKRHIEAIHGKPSEDFKCQHCGKCFPGESSLKSHVHNVHKMRDQYLMPIPCEVCGKAVAKKRMANHFATHHTKDEDKQFVCPICKPVKGFVKKRNFEAHMNNHAGVNHLCLHCGADMANKSEEQEQLHMDKFHGNFKNQCPICQDFEYSSYEEHKKHNDEYHDGKFVSRCNKCAEFFDNRALLRTHKQKLHHPSQMPQKSACHICGKEVGNKNLQRHIEGIHGKPSEDFKCQHCGKCFPAESCLKSHVHRIHKMRDQYLMPIPCEVCGKAVARKKMAHHFATHHTKDEDKPFVCPICKPVKGFVNKSNFEAHMNNHAGVKPYKCSYCDAAFADKKNMTAHERTTHLGIKRGSKKLKKV